MAKQPDAYRRVWDHFQQLATVSDGRHDTPEWRSHQGDYAVCVLRVDAEALQPALDQLRDALCMFSGVRCHPDAFLHITLQELGFVCPAPTARDEISPDRLEEIATTAAGPLSRRRVFDIDVGGINSFQDAVFLDIHDGGNCARLHARLLDLVAQPRPSPFPFLPHVTIAHYMEGAPAKGIVETLTPWRDIHFGTVRATQVEIVTLRVDRPYPELEPYAVIPLRG